MTHVSLVGDPAATIGPAFGWFTAGVLLGVLYFAALRRSARLLVGGQLLLPAGLQLLRFAALAVALAMLARWYGALPLLLATLGLLVGRRIVIGTGREP